MKSIIKVIISLSLILTSPYGFAEEAKDNGGCETQINCTVNQGNTSTTTTTTNSTNGGSTLRRRSSGNTTTTTTTNYGTAGSAGSGAYTQAQEAKNKANTTMIAAFAMAAMMAAMCNKPPGNYTPCVLAALAAAAGVMAAQKKSQAQEVMRTLGTDGTTDSTTDTAGTEDGADTSAASLAKIKADLAKQGVAMNADGSTVLPNGQTVSAGMDAQSLKSAGFSDSQASQLKRDLEKMKKDLGGAGGTVEEVSTASGGYDGGRTKVDGNDREIASASVEAERTAVDGNAGAWSGYFKQFGDSQIGVAQSDLFMMVEKRVDSERKIMGQ